MNQRQLPKGKPQPVADKVDYSVDNRPPLPEGTVYLLGPWANGKTYLKNGSGDWSCTRSIGVHRLQDELIKRGFLPKPLPDTDEFVEYSYGLYGPWTMMGVMRAQFKAGIPVEDCDGHYGQGSREKIGQALGFNLNLETMSAATAEGSQARYLCPDGVLRSWPSGDVIHRI